MLARCCDVVAARELLDYFDVASKPGAREDAFEKIMAEDCVVGRPSFHRRFKRIDVIDTFAEERAFCRIGPDRHLKPELRTGPFRLRRKRRAETTSLLIRAAMRA